MIQGHAPAGSVIVRSLAALVLAGSSTLALAQATAVAEGEADGDIIVTGSRIARTDALGVGPVTTLTSEDIQFAAPTSVGDLLQALPGVGVSLNSNGTQGTSFGVSSINLRYLGSAEGSGNRTLVLVDGKRWINAVGGRGFRDFVDLNTIPLGIVERIEVLKDGASAIYGADAIAGVVNIQTRRNLDGFEMNARAGITSRGDNQNISGHVNWGRQWERSSLLLSVTFNDTQPQFTGDRSLTQRAFLLPTAPPTSPRGLFLLPGLNNNAFFGTPPNFGQNAANAITRLPGVSDAGPGASAAQAFRVARLPGDDFNTLAQGLYTIGPSQRVGVFGRFSAELGERVEARIEGLYNWRKSSQLFAPFPLDIRGSNGFQISADQAFNPFGTANGVPAGNALAFTQAAFRIQRVASEVGNRLNEQEVDTYRILAGLDGTFGAGNSWRWDAHVSWSRNEAVFNAFNQVNLENVYRALHSPALCAADPRCTPLNIFGTITPEMADYIRFNGLDRQVAEQWNASANISGSIIELPAGPLGFAAGYEYRWEKAVDTPDSFANTFSSVLPLVGGQPQLPTTAQSREPTSGSYNVHEIYAEVNLPILADTPGFHRLDVDAAIRYSTYSTVGDRATGKVGVAWRPVPALLLRGTWAQGFRAPSILELFQGERRTNFQAIDPCNGGGAGLPGCAGVPPTYNQNQFGSGLLSGVTSGNPDLKPETAETWSAGLAVTPPQLPRTSLTVDWFRITVEDAITARSAAQIVNSCARTGNFCELVQRAPSGEVLQLTQSVVNLARIQVEGVDITLRAGGRLGSGFLDAVVDLAYLQRFRTFTPQPDGTIDVSDRAGLSDQPRSTFPRWKGQGSLRWQNDVVSVGWRGRYIGPTDDVPNNPVNGGRVKAVTYHDLQLGIDVPGTGMRFAFGVDNLFDQQPPASRANNPINFDIYTYDARGRYFYTTVGLRF
ncbi:MAG: TonB-dependent receptor [Thermaurantiacus sp.]